MFKRLFTLRDDIKEEVEKFKKQHFHPYMIGIQIRHPTVDNKGEKDHKGFPVPPLELYAQAAEVISAFFIVPYMISNLQDSKRKYLMKMLVSLLQLKISIGSID